MELIREIRKPDDEVLAKQEAEKARRLLNMKHMIEVDRIAMEATKRTQANCPHKKEDGRTAWAGQIHSDGKFWPLCLHCGKIGHPQTPLPGSTAGGLS